MQPYNDVQQWKFKDLIAVFGADPEASATYQVKTREELEGLLANEKFSSAPYIQVCTDDVTSFPWELMSRYHKVCGGSHAEEGCAEGVEVDD